VLQAADGFLVLAQVVDTDDRDLRSGERNNDPVREALVEVNAIGEVDEFDLVRFRAKHQHRARFAEIGGIGLDVRETEIA
ncbi:hypothetical protein AB4084_36590, partial [Lysobacter sp. 2RAB21]